MKLRKFFIFIALICVFSAATFAYGENESNELLMVAQKAFDDGFYDVAIRYAEQFLEKYPQDTKRTQVRLLLGQCHFFKSQYLKAFEVFQGLLQTVEMKDTTLYWLGETYLKGSDYDQAIAQYQQIISSYPESLYFAQAHYSLAWALFEKKDYAKAKEAFGVFLQKFPTNELSEDALFKLGECSYNERAYEEVIKQFQDYVIKFQNSKRHDQAYFYVGESYFYLDKLIDAIGYYSKAVDIASSDKIRLMSKISIAWSYLKLSEFEKSAQFFDEAQKLSAEKNLPSDEIYLGQANLYLEMKDYPKALAAYDELLKRSPQTTRLAEIYLGKANVYYLTEDYEKALNSYNLILTQFAQNPDASELLEKARFGLGWTYLKMDETDLAIKNFNDIIDQSGSKITKVSALTQIGDIYQDIGKIDDAIITYDKVLTEFPNSLYTDYVQYRQGIALLKQNKTEAATIAFQSLQTNFPQSKYLSDVKYYLGVAYFKKGDWANAKDHFITFIDELPKTNEFQGDAHYLLALSYFNLSDYAEASKTFQKVIKGFPQETALTRDSELNLARCLFAQGDTKEALIKFKIVAYKYPQTDSALEALLWLGDYYLKASDLDNAVTYYTQILESFPGSEKNALAHFSLGQAYQAQGLFDKALNEYKFLKDSSDRELYAKAQLAIADIFAKETNPEAAVNSYNKVAANCPEFKRSAFVKIAEIYQNNRDYDNALKSYQSALGADIGLSNITSVELQFSIADLLETLNRSNEAVEAYFKVPYLYPNETHWISKAHLRIARIFEDDEDWENAKLIYKKIVDAGTDEVKFAQERIDWIDSIMATKQ
ncbi:MAG: tetratricopeptide repeat protein [Candidatus Omnitrophota bacterium]